MKTTHFALMRTIDEHSENSNRKRLAFMAVLVGAFATVSAQVAPPAEDCNTDEGYPHPCHYSPDTCSYNLCSDPDDTGPECQGAGGDCCDGGSYMPEGRSSAQIKGTGMPVWSVEEPTLRMFVRDRPFLYKTARGTVVDFELSLKHQPGKAGQVDSKQYAIFGVGTNWSTPWRSYIQQTTSNDATTMTDEAWYCFLGDGSARKYPLDAAEYVSKAVLTKSGSEYWLTFPSGERNVYGQWVTLGTNLFCFMTRQESAEGHTNRFTYQFATSGSVTNTIRLQKVTDPDGLETTFSYKTNNAFYSNLIAQVTGPYGLSTSLGYSAQGQLTNITDVVSLSSGIRYGTDGRVSYLDTPYGTTSFAFLGAGSWTAVRIEELGQRRHLYLRGYNTNALTTASSEGTALNAFVAGTVQTSDFDTRNTFRWGPRQYDHLPSLIRTTLSSGTFNPTNLSPNDLKLGRTTHWLRGKTAGTNEILSMTPSVIRSPSPSDDGSIEGLLTWFDYYGKETGKWEYNGTRVQPVTIAAREPGGEWRVKKSKHNSAGQATEIAETITEPLFDDLFLDDYLTTTWRTNLFTYADNAIDLIEHRRYDNSGTQILVQSNSFNGSHQILAQHDALGQATIYEYNSLNQLTNLTRPSGLISALTYDTSNRLATVIERSVAGALRTNTYTWTNGYILTHTDPKGLSVTNSWDALGRLTSSANPNGAVSHTYSKLDRTKTIDRMGFTNGFAYNGFRQLTFHTNANFKVWTNIYCDCGSLEASIDPLGNTNSYTYDNRGKKLRLTYSDQSWSDAAYNLFGEPYKVTDSAGVNLTNVYSIQGLPILVKGAGGVLERYLYDLNERLTNHVDRNGTMFAMTHDQLGRVTERHLIDTTQWPPLPYSSNLFTYSAIGLVYHMDPLSKETRFEYDTLGRKITETNALGQIVRFKYDAAGNLTNLVDGKGNNTYWRNDLFSRVTNKTDAANTSISFGYDSNDRLTTRRNAAGDLTTYTYDAVGNLTFINYPTNTDVSLTYDANNRLISMTDAVGTTTYGYSSFGALQSEDGPWADDTVAYTYNNRQRSGLLLRMPTGPAWSQSYSYDYLRRLTNASSSAGAFSYTYRSGLVEDFTDEFAQLPVAPTLGNLVERIVLPTSAYVTNTHDVYGRLTSTALKSSSHGSLNLHSYQLNEAHRRTMQSRLDGSYLDYGYDDIGQLTSAFAYETGGTTNRFHERFVYSYDASGNLSNRVQNVLTNVFNVNNLNELTSIIRTNDSFTVAGATHGAATSVTIADNANVAVSAVRYADNSYSRTGISLLNGNNTFIAVGQDSTGRGDTNAVTVSLSKATILVYDLHGNLRTNGTRVLEYDDENQLARVTEPSLWKSEFVYDGRMRRRVRKEYEWRYSVWVLTSEVRYVYDGNLVLQERDQFNLPKVTFTRGNDLSGSLEGAGGIGGLLARTAHDFDAKTHVFYNCDGNGNVTCLLDTNQTVVGRYLYDPFGNTLAARGPAAQANLYRLSSKELHMPSGLVYYLYRYYDPNLQRWLNRDPIGERGGRNLYTMVENAPVRFIDRVGLARVENDTSDPVIVHGNPGPGEGTGDQLFGIMQPGTCTSPIGVPGYPTLEDAIDAYLNDILPDMQYPVPDPLGFITDVDGYLDTTTLDPDAQNIRLRGDDLGPRYVLKDNGNDLDHELDQEFPFIFGGWAGAIARHLIP